MTIPSIFQDKINLVDPTKTLVFVTNTTTYAENEWSHNGNLTITGYDDYALRHGAADLLYSKGFRFYAPHPDFHVLPASIATVPAQAKKKNFWPYVNPFIGLGHSRDVKFGDQAAQDTLLGYWNDWRYLNCAIDDRIPITHQWPHIITEPALASFWAANPQLLTVDETTFDLVNITPTGTPTDWANLVNVCASWCSASLNPQKRTAFDPKDGNPHSSLLVYRLAKAVVSTIRAGVPAIGPYASRTAVPGAQLGIYGYGNHSSPDGVDLTSGDGIYIAMATQFAPPVDSIIAGWSTRADFILIRDYSGVQAQDHSFPRGTKGCDVKTWPDKYIPWGGLGAVGMISEVTAHWVKLLPNFYNTIQTTRTGISDYDGRLQEIVDNLFDGDPLVYDLYQSFNANTSRIRSKYIVKGWMDKVVAMTTSNKLMFQQYLAILGQFLIAEESEVKADLVDLMEMVVHVDFILSDRYHSYNMARDLKRIPTFNQYPDLKWNAIPTASYYAAAHVPTSADFDAVYAALTGFDRLTELDSNDLVLVKMPNPPSGDNVNGRIGLMFPRPFVFIGPGTLYYQEFTSGIIHSADYGPGLWRLSETGFPEVNGIAWADPGLLFVDAFKTVKLLGGTITSANMRDLFMYHPAGAGDSVFDVHSRVYVYWNGGSQEILSTGDNSAPIPDKSWVRWRVGTGYSSEAITNYTSCPYLSPYKNLALIPRSIAMEHNLSSLIVNPPLIEMFDDGDLEPVLD